MPVTILQSCGLHEKQNSLRAEARMPHLERTHDLKHLPQDMFDLVCDVEKYPEFVPLCQSLTVKSKRERDSKTLILADMTMAYKLLSETFTTQVLMKQDELAIDVKYIEGPFKHLDNTWKFEAIGENACRVHFMVDYELRSKMLAMAAGTIFEIAFGRFVDAFEKRADEIYRQSA